MRQLIAILLISGLLVSGCGKKLKPIPPRPILSNSIVYDNGTMVLAPDDAKELLLYIIQLEGGWND